MAALTEQQVLQQLDIPDFRHMSKDKIMAFASMLNSIEPEVAKKAIEQFPQFARMSLEALEDYKHVLDQALNQNSANTKQCYNIYNDILSTLKSCVSQENIPFEQKKYYIEQMKEIAQMAHEKDSENKAFIWKVLGAAAAVCLIALAIGSTLLGGSSNFNLPEKNDKV